MANAYIIFHCSSRELQSRAGFDGWVILVRDEFDTEDQSWPHERMRLAGIAKRKMRRLESGGVELDMLQLVTSSHLLLDPPAEDREEERVWCIEFFRGKMFDFVVRAARNCPLAERSDRSVSRRGEPPSPTPPRPQNSPSRAIPQRSRFSRALSLPHLLHTTGGRPRARPAVETLSGGAITLGPAVQTPITAAPTFGRLLC